MKSSTFTIVVLSLALLINGVHSQSDGIKYDSESPVRLNRDPLIRNYENLTRIEEILELFSVEVIGSQWTKIHQKLSTVCARNMMEYLSGLEQKEIWAIKSKLLKCWSADAYETKREWKRDSYSRFVWKVSLSTRRRARRSFTTCSATHWSC